MLRLAAHSPGCLTHSFPPDSFEYLQNIPPQSHSPSRINYA
jgi:hypothetical protein